MDFRFAVGRLDGPQSSSWKFWTADDEAYLPQRGSMANRCKFSFHKSGDCLCKNRSATQRSLADYTEMDTRPSSGPRLGRSMPTLLNFFPTNYLSAPRAETKKLRWIDPAPPDKAYRLKFADPGKSDNNQQDVQRKRIPSAFVLSHTAQRHTGLCRRIKCRLWTRRTDNSSGIREARASVWRHVFS